MDCRKARELMADYLVGTLEGEALERFEAHLAACAACRAELDDWRRQDQAIRQALHWAEPGPAFPLRVVVAARRRQWPWWLAAAAVVAACVAFWLLRPAQTRQGPPPAIPTATVAVGGLTDFFGAPVASLRPGRAYVAATNTALDVPSGSFYVVPSGTEFSPGGGRGAEMCVHSGPLLGQVAAKAGDVAIEIAPWAGGAVVRTARCQFYCAGASPEKLLRSAELPEEGEIRVYVYSGSLLLKAGRQQLTLVAGDAAIIRGGVSAGVTRQLLAQATQLRQAVGLETLVRRRLYARLVTCYCERLAELRSAERRDPLWPERVALVEELLRAHAKTLREIEKDPNLSELEAVLGELRRHEALEREALEAFATVALALGD